MRGALLKSHLPCCLFVLERPQGLGVAVSVSLERGKRCRSLVAIAKVHHRRKVVAKALCAEKVALMLESSLSCWSFAEITWPYKILPRSASGLVLAYQDFFNVHPLSLSPITKLMQKFHLCCRGRKLEPYYFKVHHRRSALNPVKLLPCRGETQPKFLGTLVEADFFEALELRRPAGRVRHRRRRRRLLVDAGEETRWGRQEKEKRWS